MSKRVGEAIQTELEKAGHEVTLVDPATLDIPILKTPLHWYPGNILTAFVRNGISLSKIFADFDFAVA